MKFRIAVALPVLERSYLNLHRPNTITWKIIESFTSAMFMPKLRRCGLDCCLETNTDIEKGFNSSPFHNDHQHILIQFVFIKTIGVTENLLLKNYLSAEHIARDEITYKQGVSILFIQNKT